jgi:protein-disulfide isomerase/uncharacterized membrane protein
MGTDQSSGKDKPGRAIYVALLVVALIGMGLAGELVKVHREAHAQTGAPSICNFGEGLDCGEVALNEWGQILGVPTAAWGLLTYAGFALLGALGVARKVFPRGPAGLVFWGSIPPLLFGGWLAYIMVEEVLSLCVFCLGLDGVNLGLLVVGALAVWRRGAVTALREDLETLIANKPSMIAIFGGPGLAALMIWAAFNSAETTDGTPDADAGPLTLPPLEMTDESTINTEFAPVKGPQNAPIVIYEFSDYQCPHCQRAHEDVRQVVNRHRNKIRLYHFNYPLDMACNPRIDRPFHPAACLAAGAAICAQQQDKFWELNDLLFEHGRSLDRDLVLELSQRVGIDHDEMDRCLRSDSTRERILYDLEQSLQVPVKGTPTFVVNGRIIPGYIGPAFGRVVDILLENDGEWPESLLNAHPPEDE